MLALSKGNATPPRRSSRIRFHIGRSNRITSCNRVLSGSCQSTGVRITQRITAGVTSVRWEQRESLVFQSDLFDFVLGEMLHSFPTVEKEQLQCVPLCLCFEFPQHTRPGDVHFHLDTLTLSCFCASLLSSSASFIRKICGYVRRSPVAFRYHQALGLFLRGVD